MELDLKSHYLSDDSIYSLSTIEPQPLITKVKPASQDKKNEETVATPTGSKRSPSRDNKESVATLIHNNNKDPEQTNTITRRKNEIDVDPKYEKTSKAASSGMDRTALLNNNNDDEVTQLSNQLKLKQQLKPKKMMNQKENDQNTHNIDDHNKLKPLVNKRFEADKNISTHNEDHRNNYIYPFYISAKQKANQTKSEAISVPSAGTLSDGRSATKAETTTLNKQEVSTLQHCEPNEAKATNSSFEYQLEACNILIPSVDNNDIVTVVGSDEEDYSNYNHIPGRGCTISVFLKEFENDDSDISSVGLQESEAKIKETETVQKTTPISVSVLKASDNSLPPSLILQRKQLEQQDRKPKGSDSTSSVASAKENPLTGSNSMGNSEFISSASSNVTPLTTIITKAEPWAANHDGSILNDEVDDDSKEYGDRIARDSCAFDGVYFSQSTESVNGNKTKSTTTSEHISIWRKQVFFRIPFYCFILLLITIIISALAVVIGSFLLKDDLYFSNDSKTRSDATSGPPTPSIESPTFAPVFATDVPTPVSKISSARRSTTPSSSTMPLMTSEPTYLRINDQYVEPLAANPSWLPTWSLLTPEPTSSTTTKPLTANPSWVPTWFPTTERTEQPLDPTLNPSKPPMTMEPLSPSLTASPSPFAVLTTGPTTNRSPAQTYSPSPSTVFTSEPTWQQNDGKCPDEYKCQNMFGVNGYTVFTIDDFFGICRERCSPLTTDTLFSIGWQCGSCSR